MKKHSIITEMLRGHFHYHRSLMKDVY